MPPPVVEWRIGILGCCPSAGDQLQRRMSPRSPPPPPPHCSHSPHFQFIFQFPPIQKWGGDFLAWDLGWRIMDIIVLPAYGAPTTTGKADTAQQRAQATNDQLMDCDIWAMVHDLLQHRAGQALCSHQCGHDKYPSNNKADALAKQATATHPLQLRPCVLRRPREPLASSETRIVRRRGGSTNGIAGCNKNCRNRQCRGHSQCIQVRVEKGTQ